MEDPTSQECNWNCTKGYVSETKAVISIFVQYASSVLTDVTFKREIVSAHRFQRLIFGIKTAN